MNEEGHQTLDFGQSHQNERQGRIFHEVSLRPDAPQKLGVSLHAQGDTPPASDDDDVPAEQDEEKREKRRVEGGYGDHGTLARAAQVRECVNFRSPPVRPDALRWRA